MDLSPLIHSPDAWRSLVPLRLFWLEGEKIAPRSLDEEWPPVTTGQQDLTIMCRCLPGEAKSLDQVLVEELVSHPTWGAIYNVLTPKRALFGMVYRFKGEAQVLLRPDMAKVSHNFRAATPSLVDLCDAKPFRIGLMGNPDTGYCLLVSAKSRAMRSRVDVHALTLAKDEKL